MISKKYYTVADLAELLSVRKSSIYRWIRNKRIGTTRFGKNEVRFSEEQVAAFLRVDDVAKPNNIWEED